MTPLPCRHLRTLRHSSDLMAGANRLSARCSVAGNVAPLPLSSFTSYSSSSHLLLRLHSYIHFSPLKPPTSKSLFHSQKSARSYTSYSPVASNTDLIQVSQTQDTKDLVQLLAELKAKLQMEGIPAASCKPGMYNRFLCPEASGDVSKCKVTTQAASPKDYRVITEEELKLEPLCEELIDYFYERMIRRKTLVRNGIMQVKKNDEIVIAFPYRQNGSLVNCKYRTVAKKFFQEAKCEWIFYGLDDIKNVEDIIIVEGEVDKLSMEEAGYCNCISVPHGAPSKVSKELPDAERDTKFPFIWNCKEYIEKASRIIIATDADTHGQALAEELAHCFGKERCWRVKWPNKSDTEVCNDANEVLMYLGPNALKQAINDAEFYYRSHEFKLDASTGWKELNELYNVVPGELTIKLCAYFRQK